jgi:phosphoribosylglycinamide formyltransferase 1
LKVGVLISGTGSNLQALIDDGGIEIACVASNVADAPGLARATAAGIPLLAAADERETADFLERHGVGLVVLAGYMRILSPQFVRRFSGRIMNVHPSLLPAFAGAEDGRDAPL